MSSHPISPQISLSNWRLAPYSQWAFQHVRQIIPTANIKASKSPTSVPGSHSSIPGSIRFDSAGGKKLEDILVESFSDSMVIHHRRQKIWQWTARHCDICKPHIVFSVSKSITAMLVGILVEQGILDVAKPLLYYMPGVKGSAYEDASLQQLLDMTVALAFDESYLDATGDYHRYRDATGWNPVDQQDPGPGLEAFLYGLQKSDLDHGEVFSYKSPNSDLLGLVIERVAGCSYSELISTLIWQPMGAESDGYVTVDRAFLARGAGGVCVTVDDLARFGQLVLDGGAVVDRQVIPRSWVEDTISQGDCNAWQKGDMAYLLPEGRYRNQWYQIGDADQSIMALGIHGQWLYINPTVEIVIAKMASQPEPVDDRLDRQTLAVFAELCAKFR